MKPADVRAMTDDQLALKLNDLREEWRHLRFEDAVGRLTNTARIGQIKRDIARIKTIQTEREISDRIAALGNAQQ
jgi:large subunit ribosomal protein L29